MTTACPPTLPVTPSTQSAGKRAVFGVCVLLVVAVCLVFGQTVRHEFVNSDDDIYVFRNLTVKNGLTWEGIGWAFRYGEIGHWHPLTWLSHMLDCQFYGLNAGGHHLTNVLLHAAAAVLLFLVLRQLTGALWPSAFVAAVFAIHPLRAESVAWVAERKDVLSAVFFMLTLGAYVRYVRNRRSALSYGGMVVLFGLGLLAKNMLVTLPFVLLLLDYWPLRRVWGLGFGVSGSEFGVASRSTINSQPSTLWRLVFEKIPLFVLSAASCVATALVPEKVEEKLPFLFRLENALVSGVTYLWQMFYPMGLEIPYLNRPDGLLWWEPALALLLLVAISAGVLVLRRKYPYLVVGWLWYLGMLVPVSGIVQISYYAHADRYTYLPQIGLYLMVAWAVRDLSFAWRYRRQILGATALSVIAGLMVCAVIQTSYWRNSESLWKHTLACSSGNYIAQNNLGEMFLTQGRLPEAIAHLQKALEIRPDLALAHNNLGLSLAGQGRSAEAIAHLQKAVELEPDYAGAYYNLGNVCAAQGQSAEAIAHYQKALAIKPGYADAHYNLGNTLLAQGRLDEAAGQYQKAIEFNPDCAEAYCNLGVVCVRQGQFAEAIKHYEKVLAIKPGYAEAHCNMGVALVAQGRLDEAIVHYQKALEIKPDYAEVHCHLGVVFARQDQLEAAVKHYQKALELKPDDADTHYDLGVLLSAQGRAAEAIGHFQKALALGPDSADVRYHLGRALAGQGRTAEAMAHYQRAVELKPEHAEARYGLALAEQGQGKFAAAIAQYQQVLALQPGHLLAQNNLAWLWATCPEAAVRDGERAVELARRAEELSGGQVPQVLDTLAAAYAEAGQFGEATEVARRAIELAEDRQESVLAEGIRGRLQLYETNRPYHEKP